MRSHFVCMLSSVRHAAADKCEGCAWLDVQGKERLLDTSASNDNVPFRVLKRAHSAVLGTGGNEDGEAR